MALEKQIPIEALAAFPDALRRALEAEGLSELPWPAFSRDYLDAKCVLCAIPLTAEEWTALAAQETASPTGSPKLDRLRLGYCGRKDCDSRFYLVRFRAHPRIDWTRVLARLEPVEVLAGRVPEPRDTAPAAEITRELRPWARRKVWIGAGVILLLIGVKYWQSGGSLPFLSSGPKYTVDPQSLPAEE